MVKTDILVVIISINRYEKGYDNYIFFGIVRNPYDRIYSVYNMAFSSCNPNGHHRPLYNKLNKPQNFESFINNLYILYKNNNLPWQGISNLELNNNINYLSKYFSIHLFPQSFFYINKYTNEFGINKQNILKYESLDIDLKKFIIDIYKNDQYVCNFFQDDIIKNIKIKSTYNIPKRYPNLIDKIYEMYKNDFENFYYLK